MKRECIFAMTVIVLQSCFLIRKSTSSRGEGSEFETIDRQSLKLTRKDAALTLEFRAKRSVECNIVVAEQTASPMQRLQSPLKQTCKPDGPHTYSFSSFDPKKFYTAEIIEKKFRHPLVADEPGSLNLSYSLSTLRHIFPVRLADFQESNLSTSDSVRLLLERYRPFAGCRKVETTADEISPDRVLKGDFSDWRLKGFANAEGMILPTGAISFQYNSYYPKERLVIMRGNSEVTRLTPTNLRSVSINQDSDVHLLRESDLNGNSKPIALTSGSDVRIEIDAGDLSPNSFVDVHLVSSKSKVRCLFETGSEPMVIAKEFISEDPRDLFVHLKTMDWRLESPAKSYQLTLHNDWRRAKLAR